MSNLKKPTLGEYQELGTEFKELDARLLALHIKVANLCGKQYSLGRCIERFNQVRNNLDNRVWKQYADEETATLAGVFYGRRL